MVRIRYSDSVKIQISGPKKIIPKPRIEIGRRSMTWKQFLIDVCGIQLNLEKEYFICTAGYSPNHSVEGWTAGLNDVINDFVVNFTKKLKKYCVRLHRGKIPQKHFPSPRESYTETEISPEPEIETDKNTSLTDLSPSKPFLSLAAKKFASISPLKPSQFAELTFKQYVEQSLEANQNQINGVKVSPSNSKTRTPKKKSPKKLSDSVRVSESKLVGRKRRSNSKITRSPTKLIRYEDSWNGSPGSSNVSQGGGDGMDRKSISLNLTDDDGMWSNKCTNNFNGKPEPIVIDISEDDDDDENGIDLQKVGNIQENFSMTDGSNDGKLCEFDNAAKVIEKERQESGPEMQDLLTRFENSIDKFDENLLEQIKLEVISLKKSGMWDKNMKRSPLACYLIEEICKA